MFTLIVLYRIIPYDPLLDEAQAVFEKSFLAIEGETHEIIRSYGSDRG